MCSTVLRVLCLYVVLSRSSSAQSLPPQEMPITAAKDGSQVGNWRFGLAPELFFGGGISDDLSVIRPPHSTPFRLGRGTGKFEVRLRCSFSRLSSWIVADLVSKGSKKTDADGLDYAAHSFSYQVLVGYRTEIADSSMWLEPLLGFGWRKEKAETIGQRSGTERYFVRAEDRGVVLGGCGEINLGRGVYARSIYSYGFYDIIDRRLKLELLYTPDKHVVGSSAGQDGLFVVLGFHGNRLGDGRVQHIFYLGLIGLAEL